HVDALDLQTRHRRDGLTRRALHGPRDLGDLDPVVDGHREVDPDTGCIALDGDASRASAREDLPHPRRGLDGLDAFDALEGELSDTEQHIRGDCDIGWFSHGVILLAMKLVCTAPRRKKALSMTLRWNGIVVLTPSMTVSFRARSSLATAWSLLGAHAMILATRLS